MADLATLQTYLTELETALHDLRRGELPSSVVSPDGRRTDYHPTSLIELKREIAEVKSEIAVVQGKPNPRRPVRFSF
jgi:hypothetical protein